MFPVNTPFLYRSLRPISLPRRRLWMGSALIITQLAYAASGHAQQGAITVNAGRVENRVSPRMYAAFTEMMAEDVKWGLAAEMIHDRSFEQAPDYLGLPADWQLEPDTRNDNVGAIKFEPVTAESYPGQSMIPGQTLHSLKVTLNPQDIRAARRGLSQGRLSVVKGEAYTGHAWLKIPAQNGYSGVITAALEQDVSDPVTYAQTTLEAASGDWRKYSFSLTPDTTDRFAKLTFLFPGKGVLYMDQVSLEPAAAKDQVRPDSEGMIAKLHPSFIRWPGGNVAQIYDWRWGVGPRDRRPTWTNTAWSNAPEPDDFGTDEYLDFCKRLGIEPSITVNVAGRGGTPELAADWVEYVNGPATSKYGAMRAANGHPAPYGVKQWELGNEVFGGWEAGHATAEVYARSAFEYAKAMRAVDPSIRLIAVGEGIFKGQTEWNSTVLRIAGPVVNYLAIHDYTTKSENSSRAQMMGRAAEFEAEYKQTGALIAKLAPGRGIKQIVNEWNLFYDAQMIQSMDGGVYAARMMDGFERDGGTVEANAISDLLNGWVGGVIQASRDRIYGTSQYYAIKMYSEALGTERLATTVSSPALDTGSPGVQALDAVATRSGSKLYVKMSNADAKAALPTIVKVQGFAHGREAQLTLLAAAEAGERNSFRDPNALVPKVSTLDCADSCTVNLPPDSVAVLTLSSHKLENVTK